MRRLRQTATALVVWATAASTLLGSTPHFVCRCPDGTVKPFCSGKPSAGSSCCCGGTCCCSGNQGKKGSCCQSVQPRGPAGSRPSCCSHNGAAQSSGQSVPDTDGQKQGRPTDRAVGDGPAVSSTCCQKTLVSAEAPSVVPPETKAPEKGTPDVSLLDRMKVEHLGPTMTAGTAFREPYELPPPADLVTTLQRLTI